MSERAARRRREGTTVALARLAVVLALLASWQWAWDLKSIADWAVPDIFDPYFVSQPSRIFAQFLRLACFSDADGFFACLAGQEQNLWRQTVATLVNTFWGFLSGVGTGIAVGMMLGRSPLAARIAEPFIVALNSLPRIALVPLIILMFGLGDLSKIVTAWLIVFFVVFFNTFEGARSVDRDQIAAARLLGASRWQIMRTVIVPSTMGWVFASLTPALSFSLIGVIVGEFIGAEHGLGKVIVEAEARADSTTMMVAILVLMIVGSALAVGIRRAQAYLLRWQAHFQE